MILKKEFIHIIRDKITLALVLAMPIALVLLFGFTISTDIRNAKISVLDQAKDSQSKLLVDKITASGYFQVVAYPENEVEIDNDFKNKGIKLAVIIPPHFEEKLSKEHVANLQVINDVSDLNVASILNNYVRAVVQSYTEEYNQDNQAGFDITTKMLYNPESNSVYMFVPGIITLIMVLVTALMSSITLAREKETGTMEKMRKDVLRDLSFMSYAPVLFISGGDDPVGDHGKGVVSAHNSFRRAGVKDLTIQLYPGMRHEILNEKEYQTVYDYILDWLNKRIEKNEAR